MSFGKYGSIASTGKLLVWINVAIKPKTQPNTTLRISGQGLTNGNNYGDQMLLIKPYVSDIIDNDVVISILKSKNKGN